MVGALMRIGLVTPLLFAGLFLLSPRPAWADMAGSHRVAVLGARSDLLGLASPLPAVPGVTYEKVSSADISASNLAHYDTLALMELCQVKPALQPNQLAAIVAWVKQGGKLIIHDSDRCVPSVDYSWLPYAFKTDNPGAQGNHSGKLEIVADSPLGKSDPDEPEYVDTPAYSRDTDSGDANVMITKSAAYCAAAVATNLNGKSGAVIAYAYMGKGMLIYNGLDLDNMGSDKQLNKLWQLEISLPWDTETELPVPGLPAAPDCPQQVAKLNSGSGFAVPSPDFLLPLLGGPLLLLMGPLLLLTLAERRNDLVKLINAVCDLVAVPFVIPCRALNQAIDTLLTQIREGLEGLGYTSSYNNYQLSHWVGWNLIGPLVYLLWFILIGIPDWYIATLRFAAMMGIAVGLPNLPVKVDSLLGLVYFLVGSLWGIVILDLCGATPIDKPWHNLAEGQRNRLKLLCWIGLGLTILTAVLFYGWGQLQLVWLQMKVTPPEPLSSGLTVAVMGLLAILLTAACALAGWAVFTGLASLQVIGQMLFRLILLALRLPPRTVVAALDGGAAVVTAGIDVPAGAGKCLWNWWCQFDIAKKLKFQPVVFVERPKVGADVDTWLNPPSEATSQPREAPLTATVGPGNGKVAAAVEPTEEAAMALA